MHPRRPVFGLRRVVFYAFFCYFVGKKLKKHERMKQKTHYSEALAYLRDYCLRHGRLMHFSHGDIFEAEGAAVRLFGYVESGSFHYLVRNYEGGESTVQTVAAGDLVGCYPYCLDRRRCCSRHHPCRQALHRLCRRWSAAQPAFPSEQEGRPGGAAVPELPLRPAPSAPSPVLFHPSVRGRINKSKKIFNIYYG